MHRHSARALYLSRCHPGPAGRSSSHGHRLRTAPSASLDPRRHWNVLRLRQMLAPVQPPLLGSR